MNRLLIAAALAAFSLPAMAQQGNIPGHPTCNANTKGIGTYYVTDATTPTYNGALTGGGAVAVKVFCNGTSWTSQ
jgi:hypothetical protein